MSLRCAWMLGPSRSRSAAGRCDSNCAVTGELPNPGARDARGTLPSRVVFPCVPKGGGARTGAEPVSTAVAVASLCGSARFKSGTSPNVAGVSRACPMQRTGPALGLDPQEVRGTAPRPEGRGAEPPENRAPVQSTVKGHWRATSPSACERAAAPPCAAAASTAPAFAEEEAPRSLSESVSGTRWQIPALSSWSSSSSAGAPPMPPPKTVVAGGEAAPWGWPPVAGTPVTGRSQSSSGRPGAPGEEAPPGSPSPDSHGPAAAPSSSPS